MKPINTMRFGIVLALSALMMSFTMPAQSQTDLDALYQRVQEDQRTDSARDRERVQRFLETVEEREAMLEEAQQQLEAAEARRAQLQETFDENESELSELETHLDQRSGTLGELFGVFRQVAGDLEQSLFDSLVSIEFPERNAQLEELASVDGVPSVAQMKELWGLMLHEISQSGKVSRFTTEVVRPSGETVEAPVTRVGTFNMVSGGKYLDYVSDSGELVELSRQPGRAATRSAADLSEVDDGRQVSFAIDPSRGALLGLLIQTPSLTERIQQGRIVGYIILALGFIGFLLVIDRAARLARTNGRIKKQLKDMDHANEDNPLGRMMTVYFENKHLDDLDVLSKKLDEVTFKDISELRKGLPTVKVLAAIAPLLGLLGTVTGMISTFQAITLFGAGDPKLMAGGISQALMTTVLGLVVAIPLLLSSSFLNSRVQQMSKIIGEQAYGMIARKAVNVAESKEQ